MPQQKAHAVDLSEKRIFRSGPGIHGDHQAISEAVLAGDADLAEELMRSHLRASLGKALDSPSFAQSTISWA